MQSKTVSIIILVITITFQLSEMNENVLIKTPNMVIHKNTENSEMQLGSKTITNFHEDTCIHQKQNEPQIIDNKISVKKDKISKIHNQQILVEENNNQKKFTDFKISSNEKDINKNIEEQYFEIGNHAISTQHSDTFVNDKLNNQQIFEHVFVKNTRSSLEDDDLLEMSEESSEEILSLVVNEENEVSEVNDFNVVNDINEVNEVTLKQNSVLSNSKIEEDEVSDIISKENPVLPISNIKEDESVEELLEKVPVLNNSLSSQDIGKSNEIFENQNLNQTLDINEVKKEEEKIKSEEILGNGNLIQISDIEGVKEQPIIQKTEIKQASSLSDKELLI